MSLQKALPEADEYVLSLSYGKDSMACLGAIKELGWPLTRIVTADLWATPNIPADLPDMVAFKVKADEIIKNRYGITVEHFTTRYAEGISGERVSFEECFYREMTAGKFIGRIKGFPMRRGNWCTKLKLNALSQISTATSGAIQYLGIAADEPKRIERHIDRPDVALPLVEVGWNEAFCREWCRLNGLLAPIYNTATRGGCWFCHNQGVGQLRLLRKNHPDLWALLLKWDADSPVSFKPDGRTVHDYDRRFQMEDEGLLFADDKVFRWAMLDEELNYRWF